MFVRQFLVLFILSLLISGHVTAQDFSTSPNQNTQYRAEYLNRNALGFAPFGVVNKLRVKYEYATSQNSSIGAFGSIYYGFFPGFQISPFANFYTTQAPLGLYVQFKMSYSTHSYVGGDGVLFNNPALKFDPNDALSYLGPGIGLGYRHVVKETSSRIFVDLSIGGKLLFPLEDRTIEFEETIFYLTGPGSLFDAHVGVGYTF